MIIFKKNAYLFILFIAIFVIISISADCYYHNRVAYKKHEGAGWMCYNDFRVFWQATYNLYHSYVLNKNTADLHKYLVYDKNETFYHFRYSPFVAFIMLPFAITPYPAYALIWWHILINIVFLFTLFLILKQFQKDFNITEKWRYIILWGTFLASLRFYLMNIALGQTDIILSLLLTLFLIAYIKNREILCGIILALLFQFKLFYLPILIYFLLTKKFKIIISSLFFFGIFLFIPAAIIGLNSEITLLKEWGEILSMSVPSQLLNYKNQSITYAISLLFLKNPAVSNTVSIENLFFIIAAVLTVSVYTLMAFLRRLKGFAKDKRFKYAEVSIIIITSLIFSPLIWEAHFMPLILPISTAIFLTLENKNKTVLYIALAAFVFLSCIFGTDLTKFLPIVGSLKFINISIGVLFLAFAILWDRFSRSQHIMCK